MAHRRHTGPALLALAGLLLPGTTWARQNIAIGEITIGYDYQERKYDNEELEQALPNDATGDLNGTNAEDGPEVETSDTESPSSAEASSSSGDAVPDTSADSSENTAVESAATPLRLPALTDDREGDTRSLLVTPRIRVSSRGISDLIEFTYGPTFTWDEVDNSEEVGHDFNLLAERNLSQQWLVRATDSFYYGTDTLADYNRRSDTIVPATEEAPPEPEVGAGPIESVGQELTEDYGRREYWRNDFGLETDYTYAPDSVVGAGYNFGLLRNVGGDTDGYDDYDRHEGIGRLSYRLNSRWRAESQISYVKGIYDEAEPAVPEPIIVGPTSGDGNGEDDAAGSDVSAGETISPTPGDETVALQEQAPDSTETDAIEELNEDLEEYHGRLRLNYDWRTHDIYFGEYSYSATNYESQLNEDSAIHRLTAGWSHDFSDRLRMTRSAGPTFITYDESEDETGYNAYAGVEWNFVQSSLTASTAYDYEFENFDGRRSGLSKIWRSELGYIYRFTPNLQARLTGGYEQADREEPSDIRAITPVESAASPVEATDEADTVLDQEPNHFQYTEETWDAGLSVSYTFLRWYTVAVSYRYADYQSDYELDYDEHRVLCTLTATSEIFRW